jgi:hypothetical protein
MAIRAYKIKRDVNKASSFDLREIEELEHYFDLLATENGECRYAEIHIYELNTLAERLDNDCLRSDVKQAEKDGEEYILYELY